MTASNAPFTLFVNPFSKLRIADESSTRLFTKAFQGQEPILIWEGLEPSEQSARATLFDSIYRAYRNPRAHKELTKNNADMLCEFLLLNQLFLLEAECVRRPDIS